MGQSATILKGVRNEKNDGKSPDVSKSKTTLMVNTVRTVKKKRNKSTELEAILHAAT